MNKTINFSPITFSRLRKSEFRLLTTQVFEVLNEIDPELLKIKFVYDELKEAQKQLGLMQVAPGKHPLTKVLQEARIVRRDAINTIVLIAKGMSKSSLVYSKPELNQINDLTKRYLKPIVYANSIMQTDRLKEMFRIIDANSELQFAIEALQLKPSFDAVRKAQQNFDHIQNRRMDTQIRKTVNTAEVRAQAEKALRNLTKEVEMAQQKYPKNDYKELVLRVNEIFSFHSAQVKTRKTISKKNSMRKAEKIME